jgi:molecular chaperone Hsp33
MSTHSPKNEMPGLIPTSRILRATGSQAPIRWVLLDATAAAQAIADQHQAQGYARGLLAETMAAALLLASRLKGPGTLQLRLKLTGDISLCAADATPIGLVRARIPTEDLQRTGKFEPMVLPRVLQVRKLDSNGNCISDSMVEMTAVDVSQSLSHYLSQSEQVEAHIRVQAKVSPDGSRLEWCGGFLAECFPDANADMRQQLKQSLQRFPGVSAFERPDGQPGLRLEDLFQHLQHTHSGEVHQSFDIVPFCPCSKEGVFKALASLERAELESLAAENTETELYCDFCRTRYVATREEILGLLEAGAGLDENPDLDPA